MNTHEEDNISLDDALAKHLSRRLDPHLGGAAAKFAAYAMRDRQIAEAQATAGNVQPQHRRAWWVATSSTGAVAAAILVGLAIFTYRMNRPHTRANTGPGTQPTRVATGDATMERTLFWRTLDEGTVFLDDDTPARQLRRQQVEEVAWTDPASGERRTSYSIPQQEVMLVAYNKY